MQDIHTHTQRGHIHIGYTHTYRKYTHIQEMHTNTGHTHTYRIHTHIQDIHIHTTYTHRTHTPGGLPVRAGLLAQ